MWVTALTFVALGWAFVAGFVGQESKFGLCEILEFVVPKLFELLGFLFELFLG